MSEGETLPAPEKRRRLKTPMILGVLAAIVIVAGAGFWVWHEQPSFCNAICHTPMDPYLPTYEAEPGSPAVDKWGNDVPDASAMLAAVHRVENGDTCMSCHVPALSEQISEGISWATGNYEVLPSTAGAVVQERALGQLTEARGIDEDQFCMNEACHGDMTRDSLAEKTADRNFNPHDAIHGDLSCGTCHKAHRQSVMYCTKCHDKARYDLPEGWLTYEEAQQLEQL